MTYRTAILKQIETRQAVTGESDRAVCIAAGVGHKVISRLKKGENVTLETIDALDSYLRKPIAEVG